jgi:hypothetical protein
MADQIDKSKILAGRLIRVKNTKKAKLSNAKNEYFALWVEDANGKHERCLLITAKELERMEHRAKKNPEDLTRKGLLTNLMD